MFIDSIPDQLFQKILIMSVHVQSLYSISLALSQGMISRDENVDLERKGRSQEDEKQQDNEVLQSETQLTETQAIEHSSNCEVLIDKANLHLDLQSEKESKSSSSTSSNKLHSIKLISPPALSPHEVVRKKLGSKLHAGLAELLVASGCFLVAVIGIVILVCVLAI